MSRMAQPTLPIADVDRVPSHPSPPAAASPEQRGLVLALGFAVTVAMWAIGYLAMMGPGLVVGEMLFVLTLLCLMGGGVAAGACSVAPALRAVRRGALVGLTSATLNLLIIGSLIGGDTGAERLTSFAAWTAGAFAVSVGLSAAGSLLGFRFADGLRHSRASGNRRWVDANWYHLFTCVAAAAVFLLLITGGLVTGLEAGLAVPDWPNTFGHNMLLYPLAEMSGGVYFEHAHRLYGMLVGVTSITLAATLFIYDHRRWLHALGLIVLVMVIIQGVLGGLRVTGHLTFSADPGIMNPNTHLAVVHGVFGQVVFVSILAIAAVTSTTWLSGRRLRHALPPTDAQAVNAHASMAAGPRPSVAPAQPNAPGAPRSTDWKGSALLVGLLVVQLVLGALYRHLRRDAGDAGAAIELLHTHIVLAVIIGIAAVIVGGRAWAFNDGEPIITRLGRAVLMLVAAQIILGVLAFIAVMLRGGAEQIPIVEVVMTTAHQATGALLLAAAALLAIWSGRLMPRAV